MDQGMDSSLQLSLDTVISASPILGHVLENRTAIRQRQDTALMQEFLRKSEVPLRSPDQQALFVVAPLDVLVSDHDGAKRFHVIELNGTGIGGVTNLPVEIVHTILSGLAQIARVHRDSEAVFLVASSGRESDASPRLNRLLHEKLLFADAVRNGMGHRATVFSMPQLDSEPGQFLTGVPAVVVGYIREFLDRLTLRADGRLLLFGRPVAGAVNDRFCLNIISRFPNQVDLRRLATINRCFFAGGDKGVAYGLMNDFIDGHPDPRLPETIAYEHAHCREQLIERVLAWQRQGRRVIIKPQGTGIGHGIEFFLSPDEAPGCLISRIDRSIRTTEHYYQACGGAFPYTICEFVDACTLAAPDHPFHGHKYELRIVVFRDGLTLRAFPSIVKIASSPFDSLQPNETSLINNITASSERQSGPGTDYMLPLCNPETLQLLGLPVEDLSVVCRLMAGYVRSILDKVEDQPERFGLPDREIRSPRIDDAMKRFAA